jgi:hypothetical protein
VQIVVNRVEEEKRDLIVSTRPVGGLRFWLIQLVGKDVVCCFDVFEDGLTVCSGGGARGPASRGCFK